MRNALIRLVPSKISRSWRWPARSIRSCQRKSRKKLRSFAFKRKRSCAMNELIPSEGQIEFGSFRSPEQHLKEAQAVAAAFAKEARRLQLYKRIGESDHLLVEGWQL